MGTTQDTGIKPAANSTGMVQSPRQVGTMLRQAIFYGLLCAGTGASLPFLPTWLGHNGMSATQIGWILAIPLVARAITGPLSGLWADHFEKYRTPLCLLGVAAAISYSLMGIVSGTIPERFCLYAVLFSIGYTAVASITPLLDAMTMQLGRTGRFNFSWVRASGSAAFIFANICLGYLLQLAGINIVLAWMVATACLMGLGARFLLPSDSRIDPHLLPRRDIPSLARLSTLLTRQPFVLLIIALGCLQAAHSYYYAFSTLLWERDGLSPTTCGYLWAFAVLSELAFLSFGLRFRQRLGPWRLLVLGAMAGIVRWGLMSITSDLWLLWPMQLLHSFTFVAVYLAGLELVYLLVPPGYEGLGQAINSAYASGAITGFGMLFSGIIYEKLGTHGYSLMATLCVPGLIIAAWLYATQGRQLRR